MPSLRERLASLLRENRTAEAVALARADKGRTMRTLAGLLYHEEELVRWRAVGMFGHIAAAEPELAEPYIRRFLWFMAEESGTVGWGSAQAIGEMYRRNPGLAAGAIRPILHYMDDEELCLPANRNTYMLAGSIWAIGNLADADRPLASEMCGPLMPLLSDPDPQIRGLAAWSLGRLGYKEAVEGLKGLVADEGRAEIYIDEQLRDASVGDVAKEALKRLGISG